MLLVAAKSFLTRSLQDVMSRQEGQLFPLLLSPPRLFVSEVPHLHNNSFVEKLLELKPRLSLLKAAELLKILQSSLRQSSLLLLTLPQQVLSQVHRCT